MEAEEEVQLDEEKHTTNKGPEGARGTGAAGARGKESKAAAKEARAAETRGREILQDGTVVARAKRQGEDRERITAATGRPKPA